MAPWCIFTGCKLFLIGPSSLFPFHPSQSHLSRTPLLVYPLPLQEKLIEAVADNPLLFARAAYHLGNRHVPVQILPTAHGGKLRFQTDHVLAEMVKGLGCTVSESEAPFQPESGAYGSHAGHSHADEAHDQVQADLHHPGHGPHRSLPKIHQFKPR